LPRGKGYLEKKFQFIHVDDMARLIAFLVDKSDSAPGLHVLNVAGRGESLTIAHAAAVANAKILRLPGRFICRTVLELLWNLGICAVPPDALPYICGSYTMDTGRLQRLLGGDYERIIRYTCETGLADCFADSHPTAQDRVAAAK
jgi:nucleoside-diphosphate-sugar epimerase